jgi:alpha-amylase
MSARRTARAVLAIGLTAVLAVGSVTSSAGSPPTRAPGAPVEAGSPSGASAPQPARAGLTKSERARLVPRHSLRASVTDENFYFVMADRFENGTTENDTGGLSGDRLTTGFDPTASNFYNGGDLRGLRSRIDYIRGLGTTSIWLTPSFKNKPVQPEDGPSAGYHGYWITDFTQIDPHLGTNEDLRDLVDAAHERGMKVYFDIITNHTADVIGYEEGARMPYVLTDVEPYRNDAGVPFDDRDYAGGPVFPDLSVQESFPYTPVLEPGEQDVKSPSWLNDVTLYHNRGNTTFNGEDNQYGDFFGLDDLFTEHPRVVEGMIDVYTTWIEDFGIDGFRIDTMKHVNDEFWQQFGPRVLAAAHRVGKSEFFMFGEVFDTSRPFTSRFTTKNRMQSVLDFPFQDAAVKFASQGESPTVLQSLFVDDDWYTDRDSNVYQMPTFLGNHDIGRFGAILLRDNAEADERELLARDRLGHELMYFSRGNPVVYYGDEQGFTGVLGFEGSRQSMFPSRVNDYLDDNLIGTTRTHAESNFDSEHPLYRRIGQLALLTKEHPALRNGAHQHRLADDEAGVYAFSRIDRRQQREYVVALNNSEESKTAAIPTYVRNGEFTRRYGSGPQLVRSNGDRELTLTVPPLSTVVYQSARRIPESPAAPRISLNRPRPASATNSRMHVSAKVSGSSFNEVAFYTKVGKGRWTSIGTDDTRPYRVFHDVSSLRPDTPVAYRAVVLDNGNHRRISGARTARVPAPRLTIESPAEGANVFGTIQVRVTADPERASHVVRIERSLDGGPWQALRTDNSSPTYLHIDDLASVAVGTTIRYRAVLTEPGGSTTISAVRTVNRTEPQPLVSSVTIAGSLQSEIGCPADWNPACAASHLTFDTTDGLWKGTFTIAPGSYEYKAAIDDDWTVNYGAGGARDGANIALTVPDGTSSVSFTWNQETHVATHTLND